jgi:hypothetical protein
MNYAPVEAIPSIGRIDFAVPALESSVTLDVNHLFQHEKLPTARREKQRNNSKKTAA